MSWVKTSRDMDEHTRLVQEAVEWFRFNYPGVTLDYNKALTEYAIYIKKPRSFFHLDRSTNKQRVEGDIDRKSPTCPLCGKKLSFKSLTQCNKANPRRYSGVFVCGPIEDDAEAECAYVAYTIDGLLDVRNNILAGKFDQIRKVEV